jgi:hypothetical protein
MRKHLLIYGLGVMVAVAVATVGAPKAAFGCFGCFSPCGPSCSGLSDGHYTKNCGDSPASCICPGFMRFEFDCVNGHLQNVHATHHFCAGVCGG